MEVVGSEIGLKMRSAIKAKLTELGCYVDDELPDYVMVMVANKRTRTQMEDDLQLFLGENTMLFVNWLHQVLKKLQEVTVTTPLKQAEDIKSKDLPKEKKHKDKKDKQKSKKKKKDKSKGKSHHKKGEKKSHKSKKKSKHHGMIRPNVPPLLMNIEKESEPSITDVFAGQILKNHGVNVDSPIDSLSFLDKKPIPADIKRPMLPIIDPATISSQIDSTNEDPATQQESEEIPINENADLTILDSGKEQVEKVADPREEQIKEIETKMKHLKQKLTEQLDVMSDDEDFLNIRTEADELMNDFAEDVLQEITAQVTSNKQLSPQCSSPKVLDDLANVPKPISKEPMELPQIELNLPKRPIRERLGAKEDPKKADVVTEKATIIGLDTPERFTPDRDPEIRATKSAKSRLGDPPEIQKTSISDEDLCDSSDTISKRLSSKTSQESRVRGCASVVRVRPRPRVAAQASSLLLRAVADAQKSLMNIPTKHDQDPQKVKRALVLPMRRTVDPQKIVIQVARGETQRQADFGHGQLDYKEPKLGNDVTDSSTESSPKHITKKIVNTDYVPPRRSETRTSTKKDDTLVVDTINIHHQTVEKEKDTQFIVTMDGYHLNALLAKKLKTEGLLDEEDELKLPKLKPNTDKVAKTGEKTKIDINLGQDSQTKISIPNKHLSDASEESDTQVILKDTEKHESRKSIDISKQDSEYDRTNLEKTGDRNEKRKSSDVSYEECKGTPVKKRKASPIVFSVEKEKIDIKPERVRTASANSDNQARARTASASSDNQVTVTTNVATAKYDTVPPLSATSKPVVWCRAFPLCRFGSACAYAHPRCKFAAACTRRNCMYSHSPQVASVSSPVVASHVVPAANYKTISTVGLPSLCKFYPNCVNPACHFFHPKPCRYGKACLNKLECNFYHNDVPSTKWRYPV